MRTTYGRPCVVVGGWLRRHHPRFTRADKPVVPVISDGPYGFAKVNAAVQRRDPDSLLNFTERIIRMRHEVPEIGWGVFSLVDTKHPGALAIRYDWRNNSVLILHNLTGETMEVELKLGDQLGRKLISLLSEDHSEADGRGRHRIVLPPYGYRWYRVGGLGYLLDRSDT